MQAGLVSPYWSDVIFLPTQAIRLLDQVSMSLHWLLWLSPVFILHSVHWEAFCGHPSKAAHICHKLYHFVFFKHLENSMLSFNYYFIIFCSCWTTSFMTESILSIFYTLVSPALFTQSQCICWMDEEGKGNSG